VHLEMYKDQCSTLKHLLCQAKAQHYQSMIEACASDQQKLFQVVNKLLHRKTLPKLPSSTSDAFLAEQFSDFFISKIDKIRRNIPVSDGEKGSITDITHLQSHHTLNSFHPTTEDEVLKIIKQSPTKHCKLDAIPTWLVKDCVHDFVPFITKVINSSLVSSQVPDPFKEAVVFPILKKPTLDTENQANYRPVSNLNFIGKILEKVVARRIQEHLLHNHLLEPLQSAYRQYHSTETALVKVYNDLTLALDKKKVGLLVLLDLSAAFDTIDHEILLDRCEKHFSITGSALDWLNSYMSGRKQRVVIKDSTSEPQTLTCGVPQGSILGPLLFIMYTTPLGSIMRHKETDYHFYADDSQLYLVFELPQLLSATGQMEGTISSVYAWMNSNMLKLNTNKTELLVIATKQDLDALTNVKLQVGNDDIIPSSKARNIGMVMDSTLSMIPHIANTASAANFHLRNIGRIRKYLTTEATEQLVHALVTARLDYGNALLANTPKCHLNKLQLVLNTAARIIVRAPRSSHVSHIQKSLHWLPIQARINYKIALLTYKALHGMSPHYMSEMLQSYSPSRSLRSSHVGLLVKPSTRTKTYGTKAFSVAAPTLWNTLPYELRMCQSLYTLKKLLKTHLFLQAYDT